MGRCTKILAAALFILAMAAPLASATINPSDGNPARSSAPTVTARTATNVADHSATLRATINPKGRDDRQADYDEDGSDNSGATYHFEFGTTASYGLTSPSAVISGKRSTAVAANVTGMTAGTTYHFRAVVSNGSGTAYGPDGSFRTTGTAPASNAGSGPSIGDPAPQPTLGRTVIASATAGTVLVKEQGASGFRSLAAAEAIPVNSVVDTSQGTVGLVTAVAGGDSQVATFRGGRFQVRQSRHRHGMTNIVLRGGDFGSCGQGHNARAVARAVASVRRRPVRRLWAKDHHGKFQTSGRGSVATVRGTSWYTEDRCGGTLTRVSHGRVLVQERGTGRHKLLTPGESFLAHLPR